MAPAPLLLVVHGRAGGTIPAELQELRHHLQIRRGAPVLLQALTAGADSGPEPRAEAPGPDIDPAGAGPLTLVPLLLLPGSHVRHDIPAIAAAWRRRGPLRRLPFLGAWPAWQRALALEAASLAATAPTPPMLLHHPLEGRVAQRYLQLLSRRTGLRCLAVPYGATATSPPVIPATPALPLTLASNRLCDALGDSRALPLLGRPRCRAALLALLEALP